MQSFNVFPFSVAITRWIHASIETSLPTTHECGGFGNSTAPRTCPEAPDKHGSCGTSSVFIRHASWITSLSTVELLSHASIVHECMHSIKSPTQLFVPLAP